MDTATQTAEELAATSVAPKWDTTNGQPFYGPDGELRLRWRPEADDAEWTPILNEIGLPCAWFKEQRA